MTETLANRYSYVSTLRNLSNEYQHNRIIDDFERLALDESSLSNEKVNLPSY